MKVTAKKGATPEENEQNGKNQMETTAVIAASRQGALRRELEIVANNLANMSTNGYKSSQMMFVEHIVKSKGGERLISPKLTYTRDIATRIDVSDGAIETTGNQLDLAIRNDGFFVVRDAQGQEFFTRNGQFRLDTDGQIVNQQGHALMSTGGQPIILSANDAEVNVGRDGTISTENGELGKLRIVRFENPQDLNRTSGALFTGEGQQAIDVQTPDIIQGALEGSNVEPILEMAKMIELHRNYENTKSFIEREDERQKEMLRGLAQSA
jgi:flagellar basal-body rod protein FlgF